MGWLSVSSDDPANLGEEKPEDAATELQSRVTNQGDHKGSHEGQTEEKYKQCNHRF